MDTNMARESGRSSPQLQQQQQQSQPQSQQQQQQQQHQQPDAELRNVDSNAETELGQQRTETTVPAGDGSTGSPQSRATDVNQVEKATVTPPHPRANLPAWKWKATLVTVYLSSILHGYDLSNTANIQPRLYETFGQIQLLPWIALSYSVAVFAVITLARKIVFCFDMKWIYSAAFGLFIIGGAVAGSANSMATVIVGRVLMGIGGAVIQQCTLTYFAIFATPMEQTGLVGLMGSFWAIGLVVGGPIGSALSANPHATWRWAFYMNLPWAGLGLVLAVLCAPSHKFYGTTPLKQRFLKSDPLGIIFNMAAPVLFCLALTFSGPIWDWDSAPAIAVWVVWAVIFIAWIAQQYFCIFTTPQERAFPLHILRRKDLLPIWVATACGGAAYGITLYYTPLFFAFVRGYDALQQTVRILPFILVFIVSVMVTGAVLPAVGRYWLVYLVGGTLTLSAAASIAATMDIDVSEAQIMGLEGLIGLGMGMHFQHGIGLCNVICKNPRDRIDAVVISNISQYGAIAIILAVAGSIFQNEGFKELSHALRGQNYTEHDIREALAGVTSIVWQSRDKSVLRAGASAVANVIAHEFYIVAAGGALCIICALLMSKEKLDFGRPKKEKKSKKDKKAAKAEKTNSATAEPSTEEEQLA